MLIATPSSSPTPARPASLGRSEPARSTRLIFERNSHLVRVRVRARVRVGARVRVRVRVRARARARARARIRVRVRLEAELGAARLGRAERLHGHDGATAVDEEEAAVSDKVELG